MSACTLLNGYLDTPSTLPVIHHTPWLSVGGQSIATLGWLIDGTSIVMLVVVNAIALCIQVYAQGFHATDSTSVTHADRCAGYALLLFAMNLMMIAPHLLQLVMGWLVVSMVSYFVTGDGVERTSSFRAVMATRVFDAVLLTGLIILFVTTKSFEWSVGEDLGASGAAFNLVAGLLFVGIMGKVAQCPFNGCLPSVSERQMPSAALLFSCTTMAAGVYVIVRAYPLFSASVSVLTLMCWVGALTAAFSAALALMTNNFKTMLIFATSSQIGFALVFLGTGELAALLPPRGAFCSHCISFLYRRPDIPLCETP